jgi:putative membrane protein
MTTRVRWAILALTLAVLPLMACSQTEKAATTAQSAVQAQMNPTLSTSDATFINTAAAGGAAEVQFGQLAAQKGGTAAVRRFGQQMVDDHGKIDQELMQLAQQKKISPSTGMDATHQASYDDLQKLRGRAFDRQYLQGQLQDHQATVRAFEQEAQSGTDPDVKAFATRNLPTIQRHLDELQKMSTGGHRAHRSSRQPING